MDRVQRSEETYRKLCGDRPAPMAATNPEMQDILNRFIFGEVFYQGSLDEQHRELITIVVLAASQCLPQLRSHVGVGLRVGLAPEGQEHIQDYLSAFCFGDIYTRGVLDLKTRELLTLCIISALGGCESQVKSHVQGNLSVGNSKQTLVDAMTQCLPYMGFPRTLNALACINQGAGGGSPPFTGTVPPRDRAVFCFSRFCAVFSRLSVAFPGKVCYIFVDYYSTSNGGIHGRTRTQEKIRRRPLCL